MLSDIVIRPSLSISTIPFLGVIKTAMEISHIKRQEVSSRAITLFALSFWARLKSAGERNSNWTTDCVVWSWQHHLHVEWDWGTAGLYTLTAVSWPQLEQHSTSRTSSPSNPLLLLLKLLSTLTSTQKIILSSL